MSLNTTRNQQTAPRQPEPVTDAASRQAVAKVFRMPSPKPGASNHVNLVQPFRQTNKESGGGPQNTAPSKLVGGLDNTSSPSFTFDSFPLGSSAKQNQDLVVTPARPHKHISEIEKKFSTEPAANGQGDAKKNPAARNAGGKRAVEQAKTKPSPLTGLLHSTTVTDNVLPTMDSQGIAGPKTSEKRDDSFSRSKAHVSTEGGESSGTDSQPVFSRLLPPLGNGHPHASPHSKPASPLGLDLSDANKKTSGRAATAASYADTKPAPPVKPSHDQTPAPSTTSTPVGTWHKPDVRFLLAHRFCRPCFRVRPCASFSRHLRHPLLVQRLCAACTATATANRAQKKKDNNNSNKDASATGADPGTAQAEPAPQHQPKSKPRRGGGGGGPRAPAQQMLRCASCARTAPCRPAPTGDDGAAGGDAGAWCDDCTVLVQEVTRAVADLASDKVGEAQIARAREAVDDFVPGVKKMCRGCGRAQDAADFLADHRAPEPEAGGDRVALANPWKTCVGCREQTDRRNNKKKPAAVVEQKRVKEKALPEPATMPPSMPAPPTMAPVGLGETRSDSPPREGRSDGAFGKLVRAQPAVDLGMWLQAFGITIGAPFQENLKKRPYAAIDEKEDCQDLRCARTEMDDSMPKRIKLGEEL